MTKFSDISISPGSVVTYFTCGGIFNDECIANLQSASERILTTDESLIQLGVTMM